MRPLWIAGAAALLLYAAVRRRAHGRPTLALIAVAAAGAALVGSGAVPLPDVERLIEDAAIALGPWTYVLVGALAFLETGAFVGLLAPGETTVIVGGLVAGQGQISLLMLIAIVWACAVAGDVTSYYLGRRLGRDFLLRHGERVKITEERLHRVETFFEKHGGATILVGRFIGFVRALAPFVAGTSRMPLARFLPYDVLGAGAWAATFSVLGFVFWMSFNQLTQWVSRGLAALTVLLALVGACWFGIRLAREPELRARTGRWLGRQLERPALRPLAPYLRAASRRAGLPLARAAARPARFVSDRLTPGELGLELTTLLALTAVGALTAGVLADELAEHGSLPLDRGALDVAEGLHTAAGEAAAAAVAALASVPAVAVVVAATCAWALARRRFADALALAAGGLLAWLFAAAVGAAMDRAPPEDALVVAAGSAFPSTHAALAVAWVACAVVLARSGHRLAARSAAVVAATALAVAVALARVFLRAEHLSDVVGGLAIGTGAFALAGTIALVVTFIRHNAKPA
jgi:undecaprenyl-diphosphatase